MKSKELLAVGLAIIAIIIGLVALSQPKELVINDEQSAQITVSGEAERFVAPDTASVSFTLTRKNRNLEAARESVDSRVAAIVDALEGEGVEEKDIKTTNFSVRPEYNYSTRQQVFDGYRVSQTLSLTIRDLDVASVVVSKIGQLEVDNVSGLTFYVEKDEEIRDQLRAEAIKDAKNKARELARDLGVDLQEIVSFSEHGGGKNYYPQPFFARAESLSFDVEEIEPAALPVGENEYSASVSITYKIGK